MLGGHGVSAFMDNIGVSDDGSGNFEIEAYLTGALERYFSGQWGEEGTEPDSEAGSPPGGPWGKGRVTATWTGLLGVSADSQPWVGRVPLLASTRQEPLGRSSPSTALGAPGEWICAGYSGEGMVHAWLCGRALARMVLGVGSKDEADPDLPKSFLITNKRIKEARVEALMQRIAN